MEILNCHYIVPILQGYYILFSHITINIIYFKYTTYYKKFKQTEKYMQACMHVYAYVCVQICMCVCTGIQGLGTGEMSEVILTGLILVY